MQKPGTTPGFTNKAGLTLGVLVGLLVVLASNEAILAVGGEKGAKSSLSPELALVPANAEAILHLRPADWWQSEFGKKLRQQYPKDAEELTDGLQRDFGSDLANIASVTLVYMNLKSLERPFLFMDGRRGVAKGETKQIKPDGIKIEIPKEEKSEKPKEDAKPKCSSAISQPGLEEEVSDTVADLVIITTSKPLTKEKIFKVVKGQPVEKKFEGKTYHLAAKKDLLGFAALYIVNERTCVLTATEELMQQMLKQMDNPPAVRTLSAPLEFARKNAPLVAGVELSEKSAKEFKKHALEENMRDLQPHNLALAPLVETRVATVAITSLGANCQLLAQLRYPDEKKAAHALEAVQDGLVLLRIFALGSLRAYLQGNLEDMETLQETQNVLFSILAVKHAEASLRSARVAMKQNEVHVAVDIRFDLDKLQTEAKALAKNRLGDEAFQMARQRRISMNNLRQIGISLHAYFDANKQLPPAAVCSKTDGTPLLSWRVLILPYIDQAPLYQQFKLDEAWDSPHNIKLLPLMPKTYAPVGVKTKEPFTTFYQGISGKGAGFELRPDNNAFLGARGLHLISDISDGTSNTIAVVEAGDAVPWTKPADVVYDENKALPKLGGMSKDGFNVLFFDASVHYLSHKINQKTLRALITRAAGDIAVLDR